VISPVDSATADSRGTPSAVKRALVLLLLVGCNAEGPMREPHPVSVRDELRPTDTSSGEMWRFLPSDTVERYDAPDGGYRVHFTRLAKNAVPATDVNADGTPDLVEAVASVYVEVGAKYHGELGFRRPANDVALASNGGSDRFDIYLVDFAFSADGAFRTDACTGEKCIGYVVQENDFVGYNYPNATVATRILGSHEYFHAVQAAYDNNQGANFSEGTAVWATEHFDPTTNDFEGFLPQFLARPDRSLDTAPTGPVSGYAYGSALFFEFLSQKYGVPIVRKLLERTENGSGHPSEPADAANPRWLVQLDAILKADHQSSFAEAFHTFIYWNFFTGPAADATKSYANGAAYPAPMMTTVAAPYRVDNQRVFYAASAWFQVPAAGRATMGAQLVDDPATAEDETAGMALVIAVRRGGVNSLALPITDVKSAATFDTSGAATLVVAVVNTAREGNAGVLSKRPGLCIGSPDELSACASALRPAPDAGIPDAGVPDAGLPDSGIPDAGTPDAGTADAGIPDSGVTAVDPPKGCGCSTASPALGALLVLASALRRRYAAAN